MLHMGDQSWGSAAQLFLAYTRETIKVETLFQRWLDFPNNTKPIKKKIKIVHTSWFHTEFAVYLRNNGLRLRLYMQVYAVQWTGPLIINFMIINVWLRSYATQNNHDDVWFLLFGTTGTFQRLAKHPRWPMSGVTLSSVSNTNPNEPRDCML